MRRKERLPELLCPAGSFECLIAAVSGGADAVYVGGQAFGARAYAKNFDKDELSLAVRYCHAHGVKLYVTVNTLVYDREMKELSDYAAYLYEIGVDAVISADLGAIREIRRRAPKLPIHASTQMTVHNTLGANAAYNLGCERVVLARELSLENIRSTTEKSLPEIEIFLHGALCVSTSGQCLMSSLVGGRSGNRGECAQPCRLPYNSGYPLSLRDLSLASHITELIDSGVSSLKIEGRMKSPSYVYTVTSIYRKLLDEGRNEGKSEHLMLEAAFSRGGFTDGYFVGRTDKGMTGVRSEADKEKSRIAEISVTPERVSAKAHVSIKRGKAAHITLSTPYKSVTVTGEIPSEAINAPLTSAGVSERIAKMGNTYLSLEVKDIEIERDEGLNLSPSSLNALRRRAAELIEVGDREPLLTEPFSKEKHTKEKKRLRTAIFFNADTYREISSNSLLTYFDIIFLPLFDIKEGENERVGAYIPPVITDAEIPNVEAELLRVSRLGIKFALVGNLGQISLVQKYGIIPIGDFRLNVTNSLTKEEYEGLGVESLILSPELTLPMARDISGGVCTLGRIPLMLTERCFIKENFGCARCGKSAFTDRLGRAFPIIREYPHRNVIFNSALTYMGDRKRELSEAGITHEHFIFSVEGEREILDLINKYKEGKELSYPVRRVGRREDKNVRENSKMNKYANKMHKK